MKQRKRITITFIILFTALAILPYIMEDEDRNLDDAARKLLPGSFIHLSKGYAHYEWKGPPRGRVVVFVHGFTMPYFIFNQVAADLNARGFRTLQFDLYGRGFSDRPQVDYNPDLFDTQIKDLLDALHVKGPVFLTGTSMGGLVSATFAVRHPDRVSRLVLIAPAGLPIEIPFSGKLARLPGVGEYLMATIGARLIQKGTLTSFYGVPAEDFINRYKEAARYRGYKRAILSSLRNMPLESAQAIFESLGRGKIPVLLIWGKQDRVVSFSLSEQAVKLMPRADLRPLDGAGHVPHYEFPERVSPLLTKFFLPQRPGRP